MSKRNLQVGDFVSVAAQVVNVAENELTVEIRCNDDRQRHRTTLNGGQITDAVTFVESGDLPPPYEPPVSDEPQGELISVQVDDTAQASEETV